MGVVRINPSEFDFTAEVGAAAEMRRITRAADHSDGVVNLNEDACLLLKNHGLESAQLFLAEQGFALLHEGNLDVVVHPDHRGSGIGTELMSAAANASPGASLSAWSHADHPAAAKLAARFAMTRVRDLWVMQRALDDTLPQVSVDPSFEVRTFRAEDAEAVLEVNSTAFAHHPEQGHLTLQDFLARTSEDWFDPNGLFLAVSTDPDQSPALLGFHWTKVHPEGYGEVYVVAVNPKAAGRGIGTVLTNAGLAHLRDLGLPTVLLYVDGDNDPAIAVYRGAGFDHLRTEAQYVTH